MIRVEKLENTALYLEMADIIRIGNKAVKLAKEENKKFGIPETFWKNGLIYYILSSGELTSVRPEIMK